MDLNETTTEVINRHPWELSRTKCVLAVYSKYIDKLHEQKNRCIYINAGAGDLYFDRALMGKYSEDEVHAIDIAYKDKVSENEKVFKYHYLEEIEENSFDYMIMMDSLEYIEDDAEYINKMILRLKENGYFFFTLPAFPMLFSDHDINIKNLRRYDRKSFASVLENTPGLEIVEEFYFFASLFVIRFVQKALHLPIDPEHKVTANWQFREKGFVTKFMTGCLNLDFAVNRFLSKLKINFPGLSMLVVCRKG